MAAAKPRLFVSYCWKQRKEEVQKMARHLVSTGLYESVWLDIDRMTGSTTAAMASGIDESDLVLIFFSDEYKASQNCQKEAEYAEDQQKIILPIRVGGGPKQTGWLGMLLGRKLWVNFTDGTDFDSTADIIVKQIGLLLPSASGQNKPTQAIKKQKAEPISKDWFEYAKDGDLDEIQSLLEAASSPRDLILASFNRSIHGDQIGGENWFSGSTSLHFAAWYQQESVLEFLLEKAAALLTKQELAQLINQGDNVYGSTALHYVARVGNLPSCLALLGNSPNHSDSVKKSIEEAINLDVCRKGNWTALSYAAYYGNTEVAQELINRMTPEGINIQTDDGQTALAVAREQGNDDIVEILEEYEEA